MNQNSRLIYTDVNGVTLVLYQCDKGKNYSPWIIPGIPWGGSALNGEPEQYASQWLTLLWMGPAVLWTNRNFFYNVVVLCPGYRINWRQVLQNLHERVVNLDWKNGNLIQSGNRYIPCNLGIQPTQIRFLALFLAIDLLFLYLISVCLLFLDISQWDMTTAGGCRAKLSGTSIHFPGFLFLFFSFGFVLFYIPRYIELMNE